MGGACGDQPGCEGKGIFKEARGGWALGGGWDGGCEMILAGCGPGDEQCGQLVGFAGNGQAPPTAVGFLMERPAGRLSCCACMKDLGGQQLTRRAGPEQL